MEQCYSSHPAQPLLCREKVGLGIIRNTFITINNTINKTINNTITNTVTSSLPCGRCFTSASV